MQITWHQIVYIPRHSPIRFKRLGADTVESHIDLDSKFLLTGDPDIGLLVATVTAALLSGTFVFIGYWMYQTGIAGDTVWTVATWSAIGLSAPVILCVVVLWVNPASLFETVFYPLPTMSLSMIQL